MNAIRIVCLLLVAGAVPSHAQYPQRGSPDPAWNGGRPHPVALGPLASGDDFALSIASLSGTRHAVATYRTNASSDAVLIVDTVPERVTPFALPQPPGAGTDYLNAMAAVGGSLLLGSGRIRAAGGTSAVLELREVGFAATPTLDLLATLVTDSTDASRPHSHTTAVQGKATTPGALAVWQARAAFLQTSACAGASLHRLDRAGGTFGERYRVDLTAAAARACIDVEAVTLDIARAGDPLAAQALLVGASCRDQAAAVNYLCVMRVLDDGASLALDARYGIAGVATYGAGAAADIRAGGQALDAAGDLFVAVTRDNASAHLVRFRGDGALDTAFATGGVLDVQAGVGNASQASGVAVAGSGVVQVTGRAEGASGPRPFIFYYDPATLQAQFARIEFTSAEPPYLDSAFTAVAALPASGALAAGYAATSLTASQPLVALLAGDRPTISLIEYFHAGFGHYFLTSIANEIHLLDNGTLAGWQRTGQSFAALPTGTAGASDVCRFFSASFAPKSSHFYTPIARECNDLKGGGTWTYEGLVFALQKPSPSGACPAATRPLFRSYNNGMTGAPNHRFVVDDAERLAQDAAGWTAEGSGTPPVFACVPK